MFVFKKRICALGINKGLSKINMLAECGLHEKFVYRLAKSELFLLMKTNHTLLIEA